MFILRDSEKQVSVEKLLCLTVFYVYVDVDGGFVVHLFLFTLYG